MYIVSTICLLNFGIVPSFLFFLILFQHYIYIQTTVKYRLYPKGINRINRNALTIVLLINLPVFYFYYILSAVKRYASIDFNTFPFKNI